jgi:threonine dehydrogenase-like Zn-dependent dehydrogenase
MQHYMKPLLGRGEIDTWTVMTYCMPLGGAPRGYSIFRNKEQNCEKVVRKPS